MAQTAADILIDRLIDWGVKDIFGLPGDGINGIMEALRKRQDRIRFVHVRHEEAAAFMACAYAKYTGNLGVCIATSGPGGIHLLNGLYDAKLDGQPVLAITGHAFHDLIDTHTQQDVDLDKLFVDVTVYNVRVMGCAHVRNVTDLACRTALNFRGVAHLNIPSDIQDQEADERSKRNVPNHTDSARARSGRLPAEGDLAHAAEILNDGKKIAILVGQGALDARNEVIAVAERLSAPIIKALLGKAVVPDDCPFTTGGIGLLGTKASQEALEECDTLLIAGSSFPYIEFYPAPGKARAVQIDIDPTRIGLRYPAEAGIVADCRKALEGLLPKLKQNKNQDFLKKSRKEMKKWEELMQERSSRQDKPMKPQVVAWELGKRLDDDAIISCDSGTIATWFARYIPVKSRQKHSLSGTLATMANGLPYTIAAQIAYPDRQCIGFVGDGGFTMLMGEFATAVKYQLPIRIVVIKNNTLGQIKWEQMVFLGNPEYGCELNPIDFAGFARACGGTGFRIEDPRECGRVIGEALRAKGPVLIEAVVDPIEPPMPPKITVGQAEKLGKALAKGTPNRKEIALTIASDKVREMV
ncbi:MAG TPA: thiamine pyrophosphate-dependent enzyme [Candidatus Acidoferrales bacterium]|nr:thiamine pyrophosphate-dependent enzyme [Candidatus Acidoferrales bacterium]